MNPLIQRTPRAAPPPRLIGRPPAAAQAWWAAILLPVCLAACAPLLRPSGGRAVAHRIQAHHPDAPAEAPRAYTLVEIKDPQGFPTEYRMTVDSVICPEKVCRVIRVDMTWDVLGRFLRYELPPGECLEKGLPGGTNSAAEWTGRPFTEADTRKLDEILKDEQSLLGEQELSGMTRLHRKGEVDGITGATPASVREAVVEGAALTCYNLWHWAHGDVAEAARALTHKQCSPAMLLHFLDASDRHVVVFALDHLRLHKLFDPVSVRAAQAAMSRGDRSRADHGLDYLRAALSEREAFYAAVAAVISASTGEARTHLLDRMVSEPALPGVFFETVGISLPAWKGYYEIHLFLCLADKHGCASPTLVAQVTRLLDHPDFFIARRAFAFLKSQPALDGTTAMRLNTFREEAERKGRSL